MKEIELFEPLKSCLERHNYEVFEEVAYKEFRADIIAKSKNIYIAIEMKTSISLKLIEQVYNWRYRVNYVYIALPSSYKSLTMFIRQLLNEIGVGILMIDVDKFKYDKNCIDILEKPKLFRKISVNWEMYLQEEYESNISGSLCAEYYKSDYRRMIDYIKYLLSIYEEGLSIDQILDVVNTHYIDPKQSLYNALIRYENSWCERFYKKGDKRSYFKLREVVNV